MVRLPDGLVRRPPGELYRPRSYLGGLYQLIGGRLHVELPALAACALATHIAAMAISSWRPVKFPARSHQ